MHNMKKSVFCLLALLLPCCVFAHDFIVDGICYNITSEEKKTVEVTFNSDEKLESNYRKFYKDVVFVPEKVEFDGKEYTVTAIGEKAFHLNDELLSVVMPKTIVSIGHDAFANCPKLKSLTIPENVQELKNSAFMGLPSLEYLTVDEKNEFFDSREGCNAIIKTKSNTLYVGCKSTVIPDNVKVIASHAFMSLIFVLVPEEPLEFVIPKSVEVIESQAFAGCRPLKKITFSEGLKSIGYWAFNATSLESVVIPASVNDIDSRAFNRCDSLKVIKVKKGNKVYDSRKGCNAIIESESDKLVLGCNESSIPKGVKIIGADAFAECAIKDVQFPSSLELIEFSAFKGCRELKKVVVPGNVKVIESSAFNRSSIEEVIIEDGVEKIGSGAFSDCKKLKNVTLPVSLENIGDYRFESLFNGCRELERVRLGNDNETYYCNGSVLLEKETRTVIDGWGIDNCYVGNGYVRWKAKKIGQGAFMGHELLAKVTLPETLEEIEARAFYDCKSLRLIECYAQTPPVLGEDVFTVRIHDNTLPLQERAVVVVPNGTLEAYRNAPGWKEFKHIIEKEFSF